MSVTNPKKALLASLVRSTPAAACMLPQFLDQLRPGLGGGGGCCRDREYLFLRTQSSLGIGARSSKWVALWLPSALVVPWGTVLPSIAATLAFFIVPCMTPILIASLSLTILLPLASTVLDPRGPAFVPLSESTATLRRPLPLAFSSGSSELAAELLAAPQPAPVMKGCLVYLLSTLSMRLVMKIAVVPAEPIVGHFFIATSSLPMW